MSNYATSADLLGNKRRYEVVECAGVSVRIQSLSELEKSEIDAAAIDYKRGGVSRQAAKLSRARLICACAVDEDGNKLFPNADVAKVASSMDSRISDALYRACVLHVGGDADSDFDELVGNCEATDGDGSQ